MSNGNHLWEDEKGWQHLGYFPCSYRKADHNGPENH